MTPREVGPDALRLLGGRLCIDFVNTVENRAGETPEEFLASYSDLARWARHAGLLADADAEHLLALATEDEPAAQSVLEQALELREALHRVFLAIATQHEPQPADLEQVKRTYERAVTNAELAASNDHFAWDWRAESPRLDQMLWPIALSAIDLLTEGDLRRVKVCANPHGCGWLFYDGSKNLSRRWCRMEGCGSQVKMRRYYARRRAKSAETDHADHD